MKNQSRSIIVEFDYQSKVRSNKYAICISRNAPGRLDPIPLAGGCYIPRHTHGNLALSSQKDEKGIASEFCRVEATLDCSNKKNVSSSKEISQYQTTNCEEQIWYQIEWRSARRTAVELDCCLPIMVLVINCWA